MFDALLPTRRAAEERINLVRPAAYARTRNHLEGAVTGLSPYVTHGIVTLREVLAGVLQQGSLDVQHKLVFELGWREYFRHVWSHAGDDILHSLHPGPRPESAYDTVLSTDIRQGCTGVVAIDEAVRTLYATGTLHNHARMWLASYLVHQRHVHWRAGADWLVAHLLDGDLASNHLSWQWVAGTGSHKPYLFNADNVARYAPRHWHSPGSVIDQSYEAIDHIARGPRTGFGGASPSVACSLSEPSLLTAPPADLNIPSPTASAVARLQGRNVWLVHPWALRAPPAYLPADTLVIGIYLQQHHYTWPWPESRWRWVDAAMAEVTAERWFVDNSCLVSVFRAAAHVQSVDDSHITQWLRDVAHLDSAPILFPPVEQRYASFSQWWTRTTQGLKRADQLL